MSVRTIVPGIVLFTCCAVLVCVVGPWDVVSTGGGWAGSIEPGLGAPVATQQVPVYQLEADALVRVGTATRRHDTADIAVAFYRNHEPSSA